MLDASLRQKITQLATKCDIMQKNGKYIECIDIMEEIVSIKKNIFGIDHQQFVTASEKLCQYLNLAAMTYLQKQKFDIALDYLKKAELVARESPDLKATTYNNLACYYRRIGKIRSALSYLIKALQIQIKIDKPKTLADTHLNLCAVLSQLDRHDDALQHSLLSIILLQDQFLTTLLSNKSDVKDQIDDERLAILSIAYHNLGVQFQHLKRFDEALKIYKKALSFSKQNLSNNQQLVRNLAKVVSSATEQMQEQKKSMQMNINKTMMFKDHEIKSTIYSNLSKIVEKQKNLPKIRTKVKEHARTTLYEANDQIINYDSIQEKHAIINISKTLKNRQRFSSQASSKMGKKSNPAQNHEYQPTIRSKERE